MTDPLGVSTPLCLHCRILTTNRVQAKDLYLDGEKNGRTTNNSGPLLFPFATIPHNHSVFAMDDQIVREQEWLPLPSQIPWIWQTFLINADPCIKVLHTPTMSAFISESGGML